MTRKNLLLAVSAAAVMAVFNPALAQDSRDLTVNANPNVGIDANVGISTADIESSPTMIQSVGEDANVWSGLSADQSADRGQDLDQLTGLDRAHPVN